MRYYVEILGSYDVSIIGPFDTSLKAQAFKDTVPSNFSAWVVTEKALDEQFVEHGPAPIESPDRCSSSCATTR